MTNENLLAAHFTFSTRASRSISLKVVVVVVVVVVVIYSKYVAIRTYQHVTV